MAAVFGILTFLFFIPLAFSVGWFALRSLFRLCSSTEADSSDLLLSSEGLLQSYVFGLLIVLSLQFFFLSLGVSWNIVMAGLLFVCGGALRYSWGAFEFGVRRASKAAATVNFGLWTLVVVFLGVTLLYWSKGISTSWVNNYGDLTWHLGMISSFALGENFPPEYHIFPGVRLSYPFFVNMWTASFWWFAPSWWFLGVLFLLQWVVCWMILYVALRGNENRILPWTVLFGGGAGILLFRVHPLLKSFRDAGGQAHNLIEQGFPWAPFLTTIWVTQRPALFGTAVVLSCLAVFHRFVLPDRTRKSRELGLLVAGLPLAFGVLAHTHLFLVAVLYIGTSLLSGLLFRVIHFRRDGRGPILSELRLLFVLGVSMLPALMFVPAIWGKRSILALIPGWMPWKWGMTPGTKLAALVNASAMWTTNAGAWLLCFIVLFAFVPRRRELISLAVVFLFGNLVKMSFWEWDQMKFFLGVYLAFISFWAYAGDIVPGVGAVTRRLQFVCICLLLPALSEFSVAFFLRQSVFPVYSESDVRVSLSIRHLTPPQAIILAAPDHNNPVTLSGRRIFSGYAGTLSSHGLSYISREKFQKSLDAALKCRVSPPPETDPRYCPQFLLWTDRERRFWPGIDPATLPQLKKTAAQELWEIVEPPPESAQPVQTVDPAAAVPTFEPTQG